MGTVDYDDLSDELQHTLAKIEVELEELRFEANFYRVGSLFALILLGERIWTKLF